MKIAVTYKSKTGFSKEYAQWISSELSADLIPFKELSVDKIKSYDTIIHGGSLYAGNILGLKFYKDNLKKLSDKTFLIFAVGSSPSDEASLEDIKSQNFTTEEEVTKFNLFYFPGGFDYKELGFIDKGLMLAIKKKIKKKSKNNESLTKGEECMLSGFDSKVDIKDKEALKQLFDFVKNIDK